HIIPDQNIKHVLKPALQSPITLFQFPQKPPNPLLPHQKQPLPNQFKTLSHHYKLPFLINHHLHLPQNIHPHPIHLPQHHQIIASFPNPFKNKIIPLTLPNLNQYQQSHLQHVHYI
ncbi:thiamine phosphate synthase, partial [Staphylococcus hominis]|uniref:thiamine phosphate synthase n=1 Tax=Staphylococcus hominis TaxID=1290 RepID=UPI00119EF673